MRDTLKEVLKKKEYHRAELELLVKEAEEAERRAEAELQAGEAEVEAALGAAAARALGKASVGRDP